MTYNRTIDEKTFPEGQEIFSWIKDLTRWGHRRTGTPEGRKSAEYIQNKMKSFGLSDVKIESVPSLCMIVDEHKLAIDGEKFETFYINGTNRGGESGRFVTGADGESREFVYIGQGLPEDFEKVDVKDKIVVASIVLPDYHPYDCINWFENKVVYDPQQLMQKKLIKSDIYSPSVWPANYFLAQTRGAAGFVGILENYMDDPYFYCEDYTENGKEYGCKYMSIPGLWISRSSGGKLKAKFEAEGVLTGNMHVDTIYEYRDAFNISGKLKGKSDDIILVHSHHDSAFEGAVQDASGISEMLALAKYFSQQPETTREKTLMFAALDTHYTDYAANVDFVKNSTGHEHPVILDVAIEHVGKEAAFDEDYNLYETGEVETRLFYVSQHNLYDFVVDTIKTYDLQKAIIADVPVGKGLGSEYVFRQDEVISDAFYFNEAGTPVVSMVCGEQYLFHTSDTPDRIPVEELKPVGMAFAEIIEKAEEVL